VRIWGEESMWTQNIRREEKKVKGERRENYVLRSFIVADLLG